MIKRVFDVLATSVGLIAFAPILLIIAVLIRLSSPGPVFYRAQRVGRRGKLFHLYKFRSMVVDADQHGPAITVAEDRRITTLGRWLRRHKIDELPQLLNVLRGEMSLVGPRPEDPRYVSCYSHEQREVLSVLPGITSPASVLYRNEASLLTGPDWEAVYLDHILPSKLAIELDYVRSPSLVKDIKIIFQTLGVLARRG